MKSFFFHIGSLLFSLVCFVFCFRPFSFKQFTTYNRQWMPNVDLLQKPQSYILYAVNLLFATGLWHEIWCCVRFKQIATIITITMHITRTAYTHTHFIHFVYYIGLHFQIVGAYHEDILYWFYATDCMCIRYIQP